jgi:FAD/FMN-containing dehydrogenase
MSKIANYLRQNIVGEVLTTPEALEYFSTDGSIFKLKPSFIVYPRNDLDVRKIARFAWQLAERGKKLPITARGKGTDQAGAALGDGLMLVFPTHINKTVGFAKNSVTVEPGLLYGDLQRTLYSHGYFLPTYPSSIEFCTIGGAIVNNSCGEKTPKYGCMADYVKSMDVVLANGQLVTAQKLNKQQLNRKKGQTDFEGQIYRELDGLLTDNADLLSATKKNVSKNAAGYNLWDVKGKDGSFDLSKLIAGSQGTLALLTQATLKIVPYNPKPHLLTAFFDDIQKASEAVMKLQKLQPSAIELVDYHLLKYLQNNKPQALAGFVHGELPKVVLLVEFDDSKKRVRDRKAKRAHKLLKNLAYERRIIPNRDEQHADWEMRHSAAAVIWQDSGTKKALPIIEDGVAPREKLAEFLTGAYKILEKYKLEIAVWGHASDANFHMQPFLDLSNVGDRQVIFKVMDEFYDLVISLGGSTSGEHGDGRLRAPYLEKLYGSELYELFGRVKKIFDPHGILNPGVKLAVTQNDLKPLLRKEYSMKHLYDHVPQG